MSLLLCFGLIFVNFAVTYGHNNPFAADAEMQSALMPQELNPVFYSDVNSQKVDKPFRARLTPLLRPRREAELTLDHPRTLRQTVKYYTRIVTCVTLAISAIVEIALYVIEYYYT